MCHGTLTFLQLEKNGTLTFLCVQLLDSNLFLQDFREIARYPWPF